MRAPRFKSAMRSMLYSLGEGLIWMGVPFGLDAAVVAEISTYARRRATPTTQLDNVRAHPDPLSMTPLSRAERAEWTILVERLR
jgi:hypothetical protein